MRSQFKEFPRCRYCQCKTTRTRRVCASCEREQARLAHEASVAAEQKKAVERARRIKEGGPVANESATDHGLLVAATLAYSLPAVLMNSNPRYM